jgi:hypothetical protein
MQVQSEGGKTMEDINLPDLPGSLKSIEHILLADIVKRAYKFATSGGRYTLKELERDRSLDGKRASHLESLKRFIKNSFESRLLKLKITTDQRDLIIYHLIRDTEREFKEGESYDNSDTQYMVSTIVKQLRELDMLPKGVDEQGNFRMDVMQEMFG